MLNLESSYCRAFTPRDERELDEWARENIKVGAWSPWEGDFTTDRTPWIVEPLRVLGRPGPRRMTILGPASGGKSTIGEVFLAWLIDNAPGFAVWYAQDEEAAKEFAETRVQRFLGSCEKVSRWFPANRHMKRTQAIHFPHMSFVIQAANLGNVQSKHIRHMICDETHLWTPGMLAAAHKRTTRFAHNRTILELSTGSLEGDETEQAWNQGTKQRWQLFCVKCGTYHVPRWSFGRADTPGGVKWSQAAKRKDGVWNFRIVEETTEYECPNCSARYAANASNGYALNAHEQYTAPADDAMPNHYSFHWNCIASEFSKLGEIAVEYLQAKQAIKRGDMSLLQEFTQKRLAEAWVDQLPEVETIELSGDYSLGDHWEEEFRRFMTIDVQQTHFWIVIRAWSKIGYSRLVWAGRAETWGECADIQEKNGIASSYVFADAGDFTDQVYTECAFRGWYAIKGEVAHQGYRKQRPGGRAVFEVCMFSGGDERHLRNKMYPAQPKSGSAQRYCELLLVSETRTAEALHLFRTGRAEGWSNAKDTPQEHKNQLASVVSRYREIGKTGRKVREWATIGKHGNHLWDCERYQIAAAVMSGILRERVPSEENQQQSTNEQHTG